MWPCAKASLGSARDGAWSGSWSWTATPSGPSQPSASPTTSSRTGRRSTSPTTPRCPSRSACATLFIESADELIPALSGVHADSGARRACGRGPAALRGPCRGRDVLPLRDGGRAGRGRQDIPHGARPAGGWRARAGPAVRRGLVGVGRRAQGKRADHLPGAGRGEVLAAAPGWMPRWRASPRLRSPISPTGRRCSSSIATGRSECSRSNAGPRQTSPPRRRS